MDTKLFTYFRFVFFITFEMEASKITDKELTFHYFFRISLFKFCA